MDRAFIEKQSIETFRLSNKEFEHNYRVDVTDPSWWVHGKRVASCHQCQFCIDDSSLELQAKLDEEYGHLVDDRKLLREFVFPRVPTTQPHYLPVNMHCILIFTVSCKMPSKFSISIAASQVTLSQHTLLMQCTNWASTGLSLFAETTLSVKAKANM
jgi:hypothetical protein